MPRAGGPRPSSKPGKPAGRSYGAGSKSIDPRTGSGYRPAPGGKRSYDGPSSGSRPYTPRTEGASGSRFPNTKKFSGSSYSRESGPRGEGTGGERKTNTGWKPKTRYGGPNKPGGFSKSGYKGKPSGSGPKRTGARPSGKRPGGKKRS
jgi:hypothetical protein